MPRNGTGTYTLASPPGPPQTGTITSAPDMTTLLQDIAAGLTGSLAADGQTKVTGNMDWGGKNITNGGTFAATILTASSGGASGTQAVVYNQFPGTLADPGTQALPNGFIHKWGTGSTMAGVGAVSFVVAFPTACLNVQLTLGGGTKAAVASPLIVGAVTTAGFDVYGNPADNVGFYWEAIGS